MSTSSIKVLFPFRLKDVPNSVSSRWILLSFVFDILNVLEILFLDSERVLIIKSLISILDPKSQLIKFKLFIV